jgi:LysM repeat protein
MAPSPATPDAVAPATSVPAVTDTEAAEPSVRVKAIIVYSGDTLDSIAAQYYTTVEKLSELNKFTGPVQLRPGQRIYVPISE